MVIFSSHKLILMADVYTSDFASTLTLINAQCWREYIQSCNKSVGDVPDIENQPRACKLYTLPWMKILPVSLFMSLAINILKNCDPHRKIDNIKIVTLTGNIKVSILVFKISKPGKWLGRRFKNYFSGI